MHGRKMGEVMGKWAASGEGSWREEKTAARLLVGERKEKKRKGNERKMGWAVALGFDLGQQMKVKSGPS